MPSDGDHYEIEARIVLAEIEFRQLEVQKAADTLASITTLGLERYPTAQTLIMQVYGNLAKCELLLEHAEAAETHITHALLQVLDTRDKSPGVFELSCYAAWVASNRGDYELAARLIGACQTVWNPKSFEADNDHATAPTMAAVTAHVSPERVAFLRESGAGEDLFDLIEEFLARPVAQV
jgi:hypothetical protein